LSTPPKFEAADAPFDQYERIAVSVAGSVWNVRLNRLSKRNALSDQMIMEIQHCFTHLPEDTAAIILDGVGEHFCAGLDLSEMNSHGVAAGMRHSRMWHAAFESVQYGPAPVIAVLKGAVVGGGFELASAAHLRIAEPSTFFALPEGQRGLFVGGGGSVRIARLMGVSRMTDMMLTGRRFSVEEAERMAVVNYLTAAEAGFAKACELAQSIASNAPLSNYAIMQALPRIAEQGPSEGFFTESLMASIAQSDDGAKERMAAFLAGKAGKVKPVEPKSSGD